MKDFGNRDHEDDRDDVIESDLEFLRRGRIVEYVDGGMDPAAVQSFEAELRRSPELRREVERARCLRALVSTLPRVEAPETVRRFTARLSVAPRHAAASTVADFLSAAPLRSAPFGLAGRVLDAIRRERRIVETARSRRAYRPTLRLLAPTALAAALLIGVTIWLSDRRPTRPTRPEGARSFVFDVVVARPGVAVPNAAAAVDPTLLPPAFELAGEERARR